MKFGKNLFFILAYLCAGALIGGVGTAAFLRNQSQASAPGTEIRSGEQKLINPLLLCNVSAQKETAEFKPLESALKVGTFDLLNDTSVVTESIYFQDLISGRWTGINENLAYDPASLLKVPLMIAFYKEAEANPGILQKQVVYSGAPENSSGSAFYTLIPGKSYSIEELIEKMIGDSDNGAKDLLGKNIDANTLNEIYSDLGIVIPTDGSPFQISAKTYSEFFRILYNATYLNAQYSEKALQLLSATSFNEGLIAGVPSSTVVICGSLRPLSRL